MVRNLVMSGSPFKTSMHTVDAPSRKMHLQISSRGSCNLANKLLTYHLQMIIYVAETSTRDTKYHTWRVGELRFITPAGPEELTLQALSPKQRGYRVFYTRTGMIKQVCGFPRAREIAKSRIRVSELSSSS